MSFYHPELLYGLFAVIIPIIIHLFNFKRFKKVYFTNVRFLRNIQQQSKRHSQWRHLLVLLSRILAIAFLVLAFARPYIPVKNQKEKNLVANAYVNVFLDNSFSMQAESAEGNLLEEGRKKAREIALAYQASDNFKLILNNRIPESNRFLNRDEFLDLLDEVNIDPASEPISKVIDRVNSNVLEQNGKQQELYIISDFQKSQSDILNWQADSNLQIYLLPIASAGQNNVFIDSCWFESPVLQEGALIKLNYRLRNLSSQDVEKLAVSLQINGQQKALGSLDMKAHESKVEEMVFRLDTVGAFHGQIKIQDYPVTYDDQFYFSFSVESKVNILSITNGNSSDAIKRLYSGDSLFKIVEQNESRIDYSKFSNYQVILLNGLQIYSSGLLIELKKYYENSGSIVVVPSNKLGLEELNSLCSTLHIDQVSRVDTTKSKLNWMDIESPEFSDVFDIDAKSFKLPDNVDLPFFRKHNILSSNSKSQFHDLIKFDNGNSFLRKYQEGGAKVYFFTSAIIPENGNFTSHALFVPIMYNVALQSQSHGPLFFNLGQENIIYIDKVFQPSQSMIEIASIGSDLRFIPSTINPDGNIALVVEHQQLNIAGNYNIISDETKFQTVAFNYPRKESDLMLWTEEEILSKLSDIPSNNINIISANTAMLSTTVKDLHKGVQLWKLFLSLALLFLIIEVFLLRFLK